MRNFVGNGVMLPREPGTAKCVDKIPGRSAEKIRIFLEAREKAAKPVRTRYGLL
ncbi:hypothetical protein SA22_2252 [Salmonella enterica subsp. enterica serovar Agona str. 22.H.04]|uniref:Uncharacterized protein n=4 Tax=Salmonella enterica I TaxID=59201 RepID=B5F4I4_SALA4|nr:hypothetical protein SeAg_B1371 [Salmonella enterica subsp. enterica serovar Agona str. SL483]EDZ01216.1 hypothetical protein SeV_A0283 [Salmonella enterica subsp. enterica serovar Virchow str. SL491]EMR54380.1 hypothetical protein A670_00376 [Salmonella enterica subsp. enterica serovar Dublin str. UC16]EPI64997.1 hypothetical protein A671_04519 [Salmonella enterica subsp. enterica serovar Dublin str. DG22]EPI68639.1 hypothetical protein A672_03660 [Salmonella enterica subsp. enterica serova